MDDSTRRNFLRHSALGLAGLGTGLVLSGGTQPTVAVVSGEEANRVMIQLGKIPTDPWPAKSGLKPITPLPYGPAYRPGSPFRAKLSLPGEPGTIFVLSGRVWGFEEKYSDGVTDFRNRGRLVSSETGYYEVESIRPIPYRPNPTGAPEFWRCAHFHLVAVCPVTSHWSLRFTSKQTYTPQIPCIDRKMLLPPRSTQLTG